MKKFFHNIITVLVLISILFMTTVAPVYAAEKSGIAKTAEEAGKQVAKCAISFGSSWAVGKLTVMIDKLLAVEVTTKDTSLAMANSLLGCLQSIAINLAKQELQSLTQKTIAWIKTGFKGDPLFVQDMNSTTDKIGDSILNAEIAIFTDPLNGQFYPYGRNFGSTESLFSTAKNKEIDLLRSDLSDYLTHEQKTSDFANNFEIGGWNGWLGLTMKNQNNPLGFTMDAKDLIAKKQAAEKDAIKKDLAQNGGVLSQQSTKAADCVEYGWTKKSAQTAIDKNDETSANTAGYDQASSELDTATETLKLAKLDYDQASQTYKANKANKNLYATTDELATMSKDVNDTKKELNNAQADYDQAVAKVKVFKDAIAATSVEGTDKDCTKYKIITPGSVIKDELSSVINSPQTQLELVRTMDDLLNSLFDKFIDSFQKDGVIGAISKPELSGGLQLSGDTSTGAYGEFDLKDLGNTYRIGTDGVTTKIIEKRGVIQLQNDYLNLVDQIIGSFNSIMPALGELDYCIPGPNPSWRENIQSDIELYQNTKDWSKIKTNLDAYDTAFEANFGPSSPMQTAVDIHKEYDDNGNITSATSKKNPKYLSMAKAGLEMTKGMNSTSANVETAKESYFIAQSNTESNIPELKSIAKAYNAIIAAAQKRRDEKSLEDGSPKATQACMISETIQF